MYLGILAHKHVKRSSHTVDETHGCNDMFFFVYWQTPGFPSTCTQIHLVLVQNWVTLTLNGSFYHDGIPWYPHFCAQDCSCSSIHGISIHGISIHHESTHSKRYQQKCGYHGTNGLRYQWFCTYNM